MKLTENEAEIARKLGMSSFFASKDTLDEALNYSVQIAESCDDTAAVITAIMVLHNTWAKLAAKGKFDPKLYRGTLC